MSNIMFLEKLLWLYIILIPLAGASIIPVVGQKVQYCDLVFIPILILGIIFIYLRNKITFKIFDKILLIILLVFLISNFLSKSGLGSYIDFSGTAYLFLMFFLVSRIIDNKEQWLRLIKLWSIVAIILCIAGLIGYILACLKKSPNFLVEYYVNKDNIPLLTYRVKAGFRISNMLCSYIHASLVPILIWIQIERKKKQLFLLYSGLGICLIAAMLTYSRLNAGLLFSLFCISVITKGGRTLRLIRYILFVLLIASFIFVFIFTIWWVFPVKTQYSENNNTLVIYINKSKTVYYYLNSAALKMIQKHPFFGVGLGNFNAKSVNYIDWERAKSAYESFSKEVFNGTYRKGVLDPHSTFLGWGSETGIVGLLFILIFFGCILLKFLQHAYYHQDPLQKYVNGVFFFTVSGFLLNGFYIDILMMRHFWLMMAFGISYGEQYK